MKDNGKKKGGYEILWWFADAVLIVAAAVLVYLYVPYKFLALGMVVLVGGVFLSRQAIRFIRQKTEQANAEREELLATLMSMSEVYYSMHLLDLKENTMVDYSLNQQKKQMPGTGRNASDTMRFVMQNTMTDEFMDYALDFSDLDTLPDRMQGKKSVYTELLAKNMGWIRLSFTTLEADENQKPVKVICTTQVIEEEKRREQTLLYKSNTDELTRFRNRRAYEEDIVELLKRPLEDDFVYVSMNVNGLKQVTDTLGHIAGDDMLRGAAQCMRQCFGNVGKLYRTGGDDFVAIFRAEEEELSKIKEEFDRCVRQWKGTLVESLSISRGCVTKREYPDKSLSEITEIAEKRMQQEKAAFYKDKGQDRRGQHLANTALCALYTKILKVNLNDDSYQIVAVNEKEKTEECGFAYTYSKWIEGFGTSGQVHPEDLEVFLKKTDRIFLSDYFRKGHSYIRILYRRKIGEDYKQVEMSLIPADDYARENQTLFLYVKTIEPPM